MKPKSDFLNGVFAWPTILSFLLILTILGACAEVEPQKSEAHDWENDSASGQSVPGDQSDDGELTDTGSHSDDGASTNTSDGTPPCAEIVAEAEDLHLPVDILWAIDSSGSMSDEIDLIQERMNHFVEYMETTGIDYRLVLIAGEHDGGATSYNVCIPPPLSSVDNCPDQDGPRYRHVRTHVDSNNALHQFVDFYPEYADFLRSDAAVHMVVVSDDQSNWSSSQFLSALHNLGHAPFEENLTIHSVVSDVEEQCLFGFCWDGGCSGPYGNASNAGTEYMMLSEQTGGVFSNICSAEWDPVFTSMAQSVLASTRIPCAFALPEIPEGLVVDYESVSISFEDENGQIVELTRVFDEAECGVSNWHYDNHSSPAYIELCPDSCGDIFGNLQITIGCEKG